MTWLARDIPSLGWRAYHLTAGSAQTGWEARSGTEIGNGRYRLRVDPARGGAVSSLTDGGRELLADGKVGNELAVYDEYPAHPDAGEGPWHLLPKGPVVVSSSAAAESVQCYHSPLGERLVVRGRIGSVLRYTQTLTLWHDVARVDCSTTIDEFTGEDKLLRLRWPCPVPGAMPVSEVGDAVIGRGFALLHEPGSGGVRRHRETSLHTGQSGLRLVRAVVGDAGARRRRRVRAVSVAEVISPTEAESAALARDLMVALVRAGVTATCSSADKPRYGDLDVDSNLPDARIALGGPDENPFTAAVLAEADAAYTDELKRQLYATGAAGCGFPLPRRLRRRGCPARTCAACGHCRCSSSPAATDSTPRSRRSSKTSPTPRSRSTNRRRRTSSRSTRGPLRCSTAGCPASPSTPTAPCTRR